MCNIFHISVLLLIYCEQIILINITRILHVAHPIFKHSFEMKSSINKNFKKAF